MTTKTTYSEMKSASFKLNIDPYIYCPHCNIQIEKSTDPELIKNFIDILSKSNLLLYFTKIECPSCHQEFTIDKIEY